MAASLFRRLSEIAACASRSVLQHHIHEFYKHHLEDNPSLFVEMIWFARHCSIRSLAFGNVYVDHGELGSKQYRNESRAYNDIFEWMG